MNGETIVGCAPEASVMSVRQFGNDGKVLMGGDTVNLQSTQSAKYKLNFYCLFEFREALELL